MKEEDRGGGGRPPLLSNHGGHASSENLEDTSKLCYPVGLGLISKASDIYTAGDVSV